MGTNTKTNNSKARVPRRIQSEVDMMNGNDYLEIIEEHQAEIEMEFLNGISAHDIKMHLYNEGTLEEIKREYGYDEFAQEWAEESQAGQTDEAYDRMKDAKAEEEIK